MSRLNVTVSVVLLGGLALIPARAADPPVFFNPMKGFVRSPFSAEFEVYSGAITGKSIGASFNSITRGDYGLRFTFGFLKALNFNVNYLYSSQARSFTAVTPPIGTLPSGSALLRAANLNMLFGSGEFNFARTKNASFYFSPGVGFARNGGRSITVITPLGTTPGSLVLGAVSSSIFPGTAVTFNLGAGVKVFPLKHLGFRIDLRDHVSGGGTGTLNPNKNLVISGTTISNPQQFFGPVPVNNNIVFTLGLIFKIL